MDRPIPTDVDLFSLPDGLPAPVDDGAAEHLRGRTIPHVVLRSTGGRDIDIGKVAEHLSVFFVYPATIRPGVPIPGEWSAIPGARGCTLQNCGFRDRYAEFRALGCQVLGVSGQGEDAPRGLADQLEFAQRVGLPFELLNDSGLELARALDLPTFVASLRSPTTMFEGRSYMFPLQGRTLLKRLTMVADAGAIERVFYPVFPPDQNATAVLEYLRSRKVRYGPSRRDRVTGP